MAVTDLASTPSSPPHLAAPTHARTCAGLGMINVRRQPSQQTPHNVPKCPSAPSAGVDAAMSSEGPFDALGGEQSPLCRALRI
jgi:hypothetical protein